MRKYKNQKTETEPALDRFTTIIASGDNWFLARCMELGLIGQGRTESEARENLREAIRRHLSARGDGGAPLHA